MRSLLFLPILGYLTACSKTGVEGRVVNGFSGEGEPDVTVTLDGTRTSVSTTADGRYVLTDIAPGPQTLVIDKAGYTPSTSLKITVPNGDIVLASDLRVWLTPPGDGAFIYVDGAYTSFPTERSAKPATYPPGARLVYQNIEGASDWSGRPFNPLPSDGKSIKATDNLLVDGLHEVLFTPSRSGLWDIMSTRKAVRVHVPEAPVEVVVTDLGKAIVLEPSRYEIDAPQWTATKEYLLDLCAAASPPAITCAKGSIGPCTASACETIKTAYATPTTEPDCRHVRLDVEEKGPAVFFPCGNPPGGQARIAFRPTSDGKAWVPSEVIIWPDRQERRECEERCAVALTDCRRPCGGDRTESQNYNNDIDVCIATTPGTGLGGKDIRPCRAERAAAREVCFSACTTPNMQCNRACDWIGP